MNTRRKIIFNWENFDTIAPELLSPKATKSLEVQSDFGKISQVESDDEICSGRLGSPFAVKKS